MQRHEQNSDHSRETWHRILRRHLLEIARIHFTECIYSSVSNFVKKISYRRIGFFSRKCPLQYWRPFRFGRTPVDRDYTIIGKVKLHRLFATAFIRVKWPCNKEKVTSITTNTFWSFKGIPCIKKDIIIICMLLLFLDNRGMSFGLKHEKWV